MSLEHQSRYMLPPSAAASGSASAPVIYSRTMIGRPDCAALGRGKNRPMAIFPGPAIRMGASSPMSARLYSNPTALMKKPFLP